MLFSLSRYDWFGQRPVNTYSQLMLEVAVEHLVVTIPKCAARNQQGHYLAVVTAGVTSSWYTRKAANAPASKCVNTLRVRSCVLYSLVMRSG